MFVFLTGIFPFDSEDEDELFELIAAANVSMDADRLRGTSDGAKSLLRGLLEKRPKRRLTADDAAKHPWLAADDDDPALLPSAQVLLRELASDSD